MIFDEIQKIMSMDSARRISRRTGINREKVRRMANGLSFVLDYDTYFALKKMGYEIKILREK